MVGIAALSFIAIFFLNIPFPLIVLGPGLLGLAGHYFLPAKLAAFASIQWLKVGMTTVIAAAGLIGLIWYQIIF